MSRTYQSFPAECHVEDKQIVAGIMLWITCLNAGEELKYGGSDEEVAQLLHGAFLRSKKNKNRESCKVLVCVNERFIDVYDHINNEMLLTFRLIDVKDITKGQDRYSKFSVLVAKEHNDTSFKAYIFYEKKTPCFYDITRRAFQLGFDVLKRAGSVTRYLQSDHLARRRQLDNVDMSNRRLKDETDSKNCFFGETADMSDSDDEFEWSSDQVFLLNANKTTVEFHKEPATLQNRSSLRGKQYKSII
jgi:hypothetical protein